jgi:preprotein translocase subunit SecG
MLSFSFYTCLVLFIIVCLFLILLILIQKGRGGGLASAFGGAGGNTAFGSKTGDVLTWATSIVFGIFIVLAVVLNLISNRMDEKYRADLAAQNTILAPTPQMPQMPQGLESILGGNAPGAPGAAPAPADTPVESPTPAPAAPPTTAPAAQ